MIGFGIDEIQANYVAEIKLRHLNREYILNRTKELSELEKKIAELTETLESPRKIKAILIDELSEVARKYGQPRKTLLLYQEDTEELFETEDIPDYPVNLFFTKEGYFKKITPASLRMGSIQKLKDGDEIAVHAETSNTAELIFLSDKAKAYKAKAADFDDTKASLLGDYIPAKLSFDEGERAAYMLCTADYSEQLVLVFENGKLGKIPLAAYETKTNRKKLTGAYSDKSPLVAVFSIKEDVELMLESSGGRVLLVHTAMIPLKATRDTQGISGMTLKKGARLTGAQLYREGMFEAPHRYRTKNLPAAGSILKAEDLGEQLSL